MNKRIVLDTDIVQVCDRCGKDIEGKMVVYGVGGSQYLRVYHPVCPPSEEQNEDNDQTNQDTGIPW